VYVCGGKGKPFFCVLGNCLNKDLCHFPFFGFLKTVFGVFNFNYSFCLCFLYVCCGGKGKPLFYALNKDLCHMQVGSLVK
jgi:hypothetical protein